MPRIWFAPPRPGATWGQSRPKNLICCEWSRDLATTVAAWPEVVRRQQILKKSEMGKFKKKCHCRQLRRTPTAETARATGRFLVWFLLAVSCVAGQRKRRYRAAQTAPTRRDESPELLSPHDGRRARQLQETAVRLHGSGSALEVSASRHAAPAPMLRVTYQVPRTPATTKARVALESSIAVNPADAFSHCYYGVSRHTVPSWRRHSTTARAPGSTPFPSALLVGLVLQDAQRYAEALSAAQRSLAIDPTLLHAFRFVPSALHAEDSYVLQRTPPPVLTHTIALLCCQSLCAHATSSQPKRRGSVAIQHRAGSSR